jgi:hypothetical protein
MTDRSKFRVIEGGWREGCLVQLRPPSPSPLPEAQAELLRTFMQFLRININVTASAYGSMATVLSVATTVIEQMVREETDNGPH